MNSAIGLSLLLTLLSGGGEASANETAAALVGERQCTEIASLFEELDTAALLETKCTPRSKCCKVCSKGKACGDSCISKKYNCKKGSGCACNASQVCKAAAISQEATSSLLLTRLDFGSLQSP